ncbi:hypothetical protein CYMTET_30166 [Cymbomonas tetramitiformis]|uniref:Uncharacterized protein n=1 Tax=Cymbomonas tetramitiformis TaxID=36881 RepID=A0AAE0FJH4_9CHLO|nr:hypothetical protein CYMTET_30166 [Cymbomonas tetramitiformis]
MASEGSLQPACALAPYRADLPFLFFGEEIDVLVRMWTRGWDVFAPPSTVVYHLWSRQHRPTFSQEVPQKPEVKAASQHKVLQLLGAGGAHGPHTQSGEAGPSADPLSATSCGPLLPSSALGSDRSLADFERFCGVNFAKRSVTQHAKCGGLEEAAFQESVADSILSMLQNVALSPQ